ncbi:Flavodoxin-like fold protein [Aspergillus sclerotialis]|uniref:Flavodoxin-like fold protein n=1 Tax=Aspergillus sclerotialis TaxID=2070753 RepID=A0A3A2ZHF1_9EURO|nr:Flavodoxin-like fold protein [Aspergillus sclerotialis]
MHLLTVFSHPLPDKYPAAIVEAFHAPILAAGHSIDLLDLHAEAFDPRFTEADHAHFWGGPKPEDVAAYQRRVEKADRLVFIFPVYWWGMPAMMKGWIERVFTGGWAYIFGAGVQDRGVAPPKALLGNRPTILIGIGGASRKTYEKYGYNTAMCSQIVLGTFAYCGITDVQSHLILDVEGDANSELREQHLEKVKRIAGEFLSPTRQIRNAKDDHLSGFVCH